MTLPLLHQRVFNVSFDRHPSFGQRGISASIRPAKRERIIAPVRREDQRE